MSSPGRGIERVGLRPDRGRQDRRGEFAVFLALAGGQKCYYTTPIKALSNQKYNDLVDRHGSDRVGLLTGDNSINAAAPIVVMTTEVLRNMLYVGSDALTGLGYVVMDEVHYLGDRFRGAVWEEVLIHLPDSVRLVSLSATVSNAEEFGDWLVTVRGDTRVIVHEQRPVPLWQHVLVGSRLFDLFQDADATSATVEGSADVNPELRQYLSDRMRASDGRHAGTRPSARRWLAPAAPAGRGRAVGSRGLAAAHHLHLQPRRVRRGSTPVRASGALADRSGGTRRDHRARGGANGRDSVGGPRGARILGMARRTAPRGGRTPCRLDTSVQGDRRRAVRPRSGPRCVRHRDARFGHQHASPLCAARAADEVQR